MRLRRIAVLAALLTPVLLLGTAGWGQAGTTDTSGRTAAASRQAPASVLPSSTRLKNAKGRTDGCQVRMPVLLQVPQAGDMTIEIRDDESCPKSARIHWMALSLTVHQVLPNGSWTLIKPRGLSWRISSPPSAPAITDPGEGGAYLDCPAFGLTGSVDLLVSMQLKARRAQSATTTYSAVVERRQTVSCAAPGQAG
jgi:hypothetical protein